MKKHLAILGMSLAVIASGCGNEEVEKNEGKANGTEETSAAAEQAVQEVKELSIKETIEQLGNESLSGNVRDFSSANVSEKDGYTYIVNPLQTESDVYPEEETGKANYQFDVSVLKDNKWLVKQKIVDLSDKIWDTGNADSERTNEFVNLGDTVLVLTKTTTDDTTSEKIHKISFDQDGEATHKVVKEREYKTEDNTVTTRLLNESKDTYIFETDEANPEQPTFKMFNPEGEEVASIENKNDSFPANDLVYPVLYDDEREVLLFKTEAGAFMGAEVYDVKADDLVWNKDGSEKKYDISHELPKSLYNTKAGVYVFSSPYSNSSILSYSKLGKEAEEISTLEISTEIEYENSVMSVDDENLYVYTFVEYKGKPTVQKYVVPRIDQ